jgi:hypothetical protein
VRIFIDESGSFIPLNGSKRKYSALVAVVIPDQQYDAVAQDFERFRRQVIGGDGELKGSSLNEKQAARVISLLRAHDVLVDACVVDMGKHSKADMERYREHQARLIEAAVNAENPPHQHNEVRRLATITRGLPPQLVAQADLTVRVIQRLIPTMLMFYVQRMPEELGAFSWVVDPKGTSRTPFEELWTTLIIPFLDTVSPGDPLRLIIGADYSHLRRFIVRRSAADGRPEEGLSLNMVLKDLSFPPSHEVVGLQIADHLASICSRALNGTLKEPGWQDLGRLMIRRRERTLRFTRFAVESKKKSEIAYDVLSARVADAVARTAKGVWLEGWKPSHDSPDAG